jgi:fibronectin-binding autotransporter adhesin
VSLAAADSFKIRLGLSAHYQNSWTDQAGQAGHLHACGIANLYYEAIPTTRTDLAGVRLVSALNPLWAGLGLGGTYSWQDDKYAVHGEATLDTSLGDFGYSYDLAGTAGIDIRF